MGSKTVSTVWTEVVAVEGRGVLEGRLVQHTQGIERRMPATEEVEPRTVEPESE